MSDLGDLDGLDTSEMTEDQIENATRLARLIQVQRQGAADDLIALATQTRPKRSAKVAQTHQALRSSYGSGWDLADALVNCLQQNSILFIDAARSAPDSEHHRKLAMAVVYSAGTLIVQEIHALASAGFWAGAAARWRSLHELAVTANALLIGGNDVAERYLDHGYVVQTRRLSEFFAVHRRGPVSEKELRERAARSKELIERHTSPGDPVSFADPYGWALPLMPIGRKGQPIRPTLPELERIVDYEDSRLLVNSSHGVVHGDSAGVVAMVLQDAGWALGPSEEGIPNVMRMTAATAQRLIASVHFSFEPHFGPEDDKYSLLGAAATAVADRVLGAFSTGGLGFQHPTR